MAAMHDIVCLDRNLQQHTDSASSREPIVALPEDTVEQPPVGGPLTTRIHQRHPVGHINLDADIVV